MEVDWAVVGILVTVMVAGMGGLLKAIKWLLDRHMLRLDSELQALKSAVGERSQQLATLERDLYQFKAHVAERYVGREDWIRFAATMDRKLDLLRDQVGRLRETRDE